MNTLSVFFGGLELTLDTAACAYTVRTGNRVWKQVPEVEPFVTFQSGENRIGVALREAKKITHERYESGAGQGIRTVYEGFSAGGQEMDCAFETLAWIDSAGGLRFELLPLRETDGAVHTVAWPGAFDTAGSGGYAVVPHMQGMLVPDDWSKKTRQYEEGRYNMRDNYMPFHGRVCGGGGYIGICETPEDGGTHYVHEAGAPCRILPKWFTSLGRIRCRRVMLYRFAENCDYNTICKIYREYIRTQGRLVTLAQKIVRNPLVAKLIGSPVFHTGIWYNIQPDSSYYDHKNPPKNELTNTFDGCAALLRKLRDKGYERMYVHVDGWGAEGYDNVHPDALPPCEAAGGWDGMRRLGRTAEELGYIFALHDQYRDYYFRAPTFRLEEACMKADGGYDEDSTWYGGRQVMLCGLLAPHYVRRNYREIVAEGTRVRGVYLDVFAIAAIDECFHPRHRMSRRDCMKARIECFEHIRSLGMIISSEEPVDYAVPHLDLVHHGPYALTPSLEKGEGMGIPVPLFGLVYHDCIQLPWSVGKGRGSWGLPNTDSCFLHGLLNAGMPYVSPGETDEDTERAKLVCSLNEKCAQSEMLRHEFVGGNLRRQRVTYANGVTVDVDFDSDSYTINE